MRMRMRMGVSVIVSRDYIWLKGMPIRMLWVIMVIVTIDMMSRKSKSSRFFLLGFDRRRQYRCLRPIPRSRMASRSSSAVSKRSRRHLQGARHGGRSQVFAALCKRYFGRSGWSSILLPTWARLSYGRTAGRQLVAWTWRLGTWKRNREGPCLDNHTFVRED